MEGKKKLVLAKEAKAAKKKKKAQKLANRMLSAREKEAQALINPLGVDGILIGGEPPILEGIEEIVEGFVFVVKHAVTVEGFACGVILWLAGSTGRST